MRAFLLAGCLGMGLVCAAASGALAGTTAGAAPASVPATAVAPGSALAILDVYRIFQESLAAQSVKQQLEARRAKFQSEFAKDEAELRKAEGELASARLTLSPERFGEREQQLRQRFVTTERRVQSRRKALDQASTDSMNTVSKNLVEIASAVARERGMALVLAKQQAFWNDPRLEITDEVLGRLNKALPRLDVTFPAEEAPPAASAPPPAPPSGAGGAKPKK